MLQLLQIQQYLREGRMAEALADLQVLIVREPDNGRARAMLGQLFMNQLQDYPSAEEHFRAAMRLVPAWPELYYDYCRLLLLLDRGAETIALLNRSLEVPGIEKDRIYFLFAQLYERQQHWDDAVEYYSKALQYTLIDEHLEQYRRSLERIKLKRG
jgi:predicted Zn-dependent protease